MLPLLAMADPQRTLAWRDGVAVSAAQFLDHVEQVAHDCPTRRPR